MRNLRGYPPRQMGLGRMGAADMAIASAPDRDPDYERYTQGRRFKFTYQTPAITLAGATTTTQIIQFDLDSVFCWLKTTFFTDITAQLISTQIIPVVSVLITDTGSGQAYSNAAIPIGALAGTAQLPYVEPTPQFIQPNSTLQFQFTNLTATTTYTGLRLQLQGFKIYGTQPPGQL